MFPGQSSALCARVSQLDALFRETLASDADPIVLTRELRELTSDLKRASRPDAIDEAGRARLHATLTRIKIVCSGIADFTRYCDGAEKSVSQQTADILQRFCRSSAEVFGDCGAVASGEIFSPLRHWFLSHFDYPYPDENAYTFLGEQLSSMTRHQIATWFINARRRSGWTDFRRVFAEEDYRNFQRLLATIDEPQNAAAKKKYDKVRLYFEPDRKDVVSETILEVIKQKTAKDLPSTKHVPATRAVQRATKRATRGVGARHEEEDELAPAVQGSWSPRRRHELPAASSPLPAPSFDPIVDFHRNTTPSPGSGSDLGLPRLPSAFVSPATSARSFSGSSSSSLDSLVSYGSSDYAPQNVRMEHTTPSAGAPAISVAPQQPQLTSTSSSQTLALPALEFPHVLRPGPSTFSSPAHPHPYFCTLNELPPVPNFRGPFANSISG